MIFINVVKSRYLQNRKHYISFKRCQCWIDERENMKKEQFNRKNNCFNDNNNVDMDVDTDVDILDKVFTNRIELFQKMDIDNEDEQRHLVDLINNVVWERQVSLDKTKSDLELCFTPKVQDLLENGKDDEQIR